MSKHRMLIEEFIGYQLDINEHVHHIDEHPYNNNLSNLAVMSHKDHLTLHGHCNMIRKYGAEEAQRRLLEKHSLPIHSKFRKGVTWKPKR